MRLTRRAIAGGDPAAVAALQALLERCADYTRLVEDRAVEPAEAAKLIEARPEGFPAPGKRLDGLYAPDGALVGVLDLLQGYPGPGEAWIGLLLLDPAWRARGLGAAVAGEVEAEWRAGGGVAVWLAVHHANQAALRFWQRCGYAVVDERLRARAGGGQDRLFRLRKELTPPAR